MEEKAKVVKRYHNLHKQFWLLYRDAVIYMSISVTSLSHMSKAFLRILLSSSSLFFFFFKFFMKQDGGEYIMLAKRYIKRKKKDRRLLFWVER